MLRSSSSLPQVTLAGDKIIDGQVSTFPEFGSTWELFTIGDKKLRLKHIGEGRVDEARSMCAKLGASVPLPRNEQEDADLYAAFQSLGLHKVTLGATDVNKEGLWVDSAGQMLRYTNWYPGEPNNLAGSYLQYLSVYNGKWDDTGAENIASVICEKSELNGEFTIISLRRTYSPVHVTFIRINFQGSGKFPFFGDFTTESYVHHPTCFWDVIDSAELPKSR